MDEKTTFNVGDVEAVSVPDMHAMRDEDYRNFIRDGGLMYIDDHGLLRSAAAQYPFATSRKQLDILIEELQRLREGMA